MENIFIILLGLSMLYLASTSRLKAHINMLSVQGLLLFLICISLLTKESWFNIEILRNIKANFIHILGILFIAL